MTIETARELPLGRIVGGVFLGLWAFTISTVILGGVVYGIGDAIRSRGEQEDARLGAQAAERKRVTAECPSRATSYEAAFNDLSLANQKKVSKLIASANVGQVTWDEFQSRAKPEDLYAVCEVLVDG